MFITLWFICSTSLRRTLIITKSSFFLPNVLVLFTKHFSAFRSKISRNTGVRVSNTRAPFATWKAQSYCPACIIHWWDDVMTWGGENCLCCEDASTVASHLLMCEELRHTFISILMRRWPRLGGKIMLWVCNFGSPRSLFTLGVCELSHCRGWGGWSWAVGERVSQRIFITTHCIHHRFPVRRADSVVCAVCVAPHHSLLTHKLS